MNSNDFVEYSCEPPNDQTFGSDERRESMANPMYLSSPTTTLVRHMLKLGVAAHTHNYKQQILTQ